MKRLVHPLHSTDDWFIHSTGTVHSSDKDARPEITNAAFCFYSNGGVQHNMHNVIFPRVKAKWSGGKDGRRGGRTERGRAVERVGEGRVHDDDDDDVCW